MSKKKSYALQRTDCFYSTSFANELNYGTHAAFNSFEVETDVSAVEVAILWGDSILHVAHLSPPRSFYIGDDISSDFLIDSLKLGTGKYPVAVSDGNIIKAIVLERGVTVVKYFGSFIGFNYFKPGSSGQVFRP